MRLRGITIAAVVLVSVIAVYGVCHDRGGSIDTIIGMCRRISYGMLFAVGFWTASLLLRKWMSQPVRPLVPAGTAPTAPPRPPTLPTSDGPGRYRVRGFDRDTHFETVEFVYADSHENAQMKVELKGVKVAAVEHAG
jgi:hypothetical protein